MKVSKLFIDINYPRIFHSLGLEPWILGTLIEFNKGVKNIAILDVGCGYGIWGFLIKVRIKNANYICGLDIDLNRLKISNIIYDDVVLADAIYPPFRKDSFDVILAIEVLHAISPKDLQKVLKELKNIVRRFIIITLPHASKELIAILKRRGFMLYRYLLRGFMLVSYDEEKIYTMYYSHLWKVLTWLLKPIIYLYIRITRGYLIALSAKQNENTQSQSPSRLRKSQIFIICN